MEPDFNKWIFFFTIKYLWNKQQNHCFVISVPTGFAPATVQKTKSDVVWILSEATVPIPTINTSAAPVQSSRWRQQDNKEVTLTWTVAQCQSHTNKKSFSCRSQQFKIVLLCLWNYDYVSWFYKFSFLKAFSFQRELVVSSKTSSCNWSWSWSQFFSTMNFSHICTLKKAKRAENSFIRAPAWCDCLTKWFCFIS